MSILLADRLSSLHLCLPFAPDLPDVATSEKLEDAVRSIGNHARSVPRFDVSNIADYLSVEEGREKLWDLAQIPPCSVPFNVFWMEYDIPVGYRQGAKKVGVLFDTMKHDFEEDGEGWRDMVSRVFAEPSGKGLDKNIFEETQTEMADALEESRSRYGFSLRMVMVTMVKSERWGEAAYPQGHAYLALNHKGELITKRPLLTTISSNPDAVAIMSAGIPPFLVALGFMNCKNVKVREQLPEKKLSKSFQKRHGRPLVTYKTLEIEPMKKVLETEGGIKQNGLKKAMHICRGHFATYTPEKGMMGRPLTEPVTVWKPAHVRGNASEGMVSKDYRVKAPKGASA